MTLDALTYDDSLDASTARSAQALGPDLLTPDDAPDASTGHSGPVRVVALDWERDGWRVSYGGEPATKLSREALLLEDFPAVDVVLVEQAHMRERNPYSVAQVYTADELARLPFRDRIRLFPGKKIPDAARFAGNIKGTDDYGRGIPDKDKDAESLATYGLAHPESMKSWKPLYLAGEDPSRRLWPARDALRDDLREAVNLIRAAWNSMGTAEKYALPEVARFCALLDDNFDALTPGIKEQFGIRRSRNGIRVERMSSAITVYLAVFDRDGNLRTRPDGGFIGCRFILSAIGMSHSHRPNLARSQLTHYGMRHYKGGKAGGCRGEYMRNLRNFVAYLRNCDSLTDYVAPDAATRSSGPGRDLLTPHVAPDAATENSRPGDFERKDNE